MVTPWLSVQIRICQICINFSRAIMQLWANFTETNSIYMHLSC